MSQTNLKVCTRCQQELPESAFYRWNRRCKRCCVKVNAARPRQVEPSAELNALLRRWRRAS